MTSNREEFNCILCTNKTFESKEQLQNHFRLHASQKVSYSQTLRTFIKVKDPSASKKSGELSEMVPCDVCDKNFSSHVIATTHLIRRHRSYVNRNFCSHCGKSFMLKYTLHKHITKEHVNAQPSRTKTTCATCNATFESKQAAEYHCRLTHETSNKLIQPLPVPPPSKKVKIDGNNKVVPLYYCFLCGCEYSMKFNLRKHLETQHLEEERNQSPDELIKCTACDAYFYNKEAFDVHLMRHTPEDVYVDDEQCDDVGSKVDQDFDISRVKIKRNFTIHGASSSGIPLKNIKRTDLLITHDHRDEDSNDEV